MTVRPDDFALLCPKHHRMVEMLKGMDHAKFDSMVRIVIASRLRTGPPDDGHQTPYSQPPPPSYVGSDHPGHVRLLDGERLIDGLDVSPQTPPVPTED